MYANYNLVITNAKCYLSLDNPYEVADKWLLKENLHPSFREQIVQFILQNTGQKDIGFDASFRDPYTGCEYNVCLTNIDGYQGPLPL